MKPVLTLCLILALAGCSSKAPNPGRKATDVTAFQADTGDNTTARESVPDSYKQFPTEVQQPIYRFDLANQKCNGNFHGGRGPACDERDRLSKELLAKGWCYGGADDPANQHWVLCAEDYPGGESWIASPKDDLQPGQ